MSSFGFIVTRHVNSVKTNKYWNNCVRCIQTFYPLKKIIIIDDNSKPEFVHAEAEYKNIEIVTSEFPGRGELLPFYYFLKNKYFEHAVMIHDSVFFNRRINFEKLVGLNINVIPLWHFDADSVSLVNSLDITQLLTNHQIVQQKLNHRSNTTLGLSHLKWYGCFGVQCLISLQFLSHLEYKYKITSLTQRVKNRGDRICLERIFGVLFYTENITKLMKYRSVLGDIHHHKLSFRYAYDMYEYDMKNNNLSHQSLIKVWTGR
jgi:hypothetical protein